MKALLIILLILIEINCFSEKNDKIIKYLPVQHEGRIKPLDTVARNSLLLLHGSQKINDQGKKMSAIDWLLDVMMKPKKATNVKLIRVENKDLLKFLGNVVEKTTYYSMVELEPYFREIYNLSSQILNMDEKEHDAFQKAVVVLWKQITIYLRLSNTFWISEIENIPNEFAAFQEAVQFDRKSNLLNKTTHSNEMSPVPLQWFQERYEFLAETAYFHIIPPLKENDRWLNMGESLLTSIHDKHLHPLINHMVNVIFAYQKNSSNFNQLTRNYIFEINKLLPSIEAKINFEVLYNDFQPFFTSMIIYLVVILLSVLSWFFNNLKLGKVILVSFVFACVIHGFGLLARMYIEGRPPVTNLYSSAIFVGCSAVIFSLLLEYRSRNRVGCVAGSVIGALTLIISHHLSMNGDTMEVMRAVLNSNFWLSTHVVTITLGYSSTFLAGSLAIIYLCQGFLTRNLDLKSSNTLASMVYRIICFSAFFSFAGTILGGFWADQSWGRFWGWDPKENGALLIILWNVLILHARIAGFIKKRGLMVLAVFGNVVTALSWFGVNMLSIGLHSYGFMKGTFMWLTIFVFSQIVIMGIGWLPKHFWRSQESW